jgi:hypothetical protein
MDEELEFLKFQLRRRKNEAILYFRDLGGILFVASGFCLWPG